MKGISFLGRSLERVRAFPEVARREAGYQLDRLQHGLTPVDWKPMPNLGKGICEIRIQQQGQYRVIYVASQANCIYVLHAFDKKTRKTAKKDVELIQQIYRGLTAQLKGEA